MNARPNPDELLRRVKDEEARAKRGKLTIFFGAAPGVGKTYAMLEEAQRRATRGTDVVVGLVETHGRPHTAAMIGDLEVVPRRAVRYRGVEFTEMDLDAVLARRDRWMPLQSYQESGKEWLFLRFYDFEPDGTLTFNVLTLQREGAGDWDQHLVSTALWPMTRDELTGALEANGFEEITCWGDMQGTAFDPETSGNLIVSARRR